MDEPGINQVSQCPEPLEILEVAGDLGCGSPSRREGRSPRVTRRCRPLDLALNLSARTGSGTVARSLLWLRQDRFEPQPVRVCEETRSGPGPQVRQLDTSARTVRRPTGDQRGPWVVGSRLTTWANELLDLGLYAGNSALEETPQFGRRGGDGLVLWLSRCSIPQDLVGNPIYDSFVR